MHFSASIWIENWLTLVNQKIMDANPLKIDQCVSKLAALDRRATRVYYLNKTQFRENESTRSHQTWAKAYSI